MNHCGFIDVLGIYGNFFHYALVIFLVGAAFLVFFYLWKKDRLNMDEEPKFQMMEENIQQEEHMHDSSKKR